MFNRLTVRGIYVGSHKMHEDTLALIEQHKLTPVIDKTFAFETSLEAYRDFAAQSHVGKVVISFK